MTSLQADFLVVYIWMRWECFWNLCGMQFCAYETQLESCRICIRLGFNRNCVKCALSMLRYAHVRYEIQLELCWPRLGGWKLDREWKMDGSCICCWLGAYIAHAMVFSLLTCCLASSLFPSLETWISNWRIFFKSKVLIWPSDVGSCMILSLAGEFFVPFGL